MSVTVYRISFSSIVKDDEVKSMSADIEALVKADPGLRLAIDFSQTFHISSRAIGLLVSFRKQLQPGGGEIALFGTNAAVQRVFEVTKINTLFTIVDDEQQAITALESSTRS